MEEQILNFIVSKVGALGPLIMMSLGTILTLASAYVKFTPNLKDNEFLEKLYGVPLLGGFLSAFERFSIVLRK